MNMFSKFYFFTSIIPLVLIFSINTKTTDHEFYGKNKEKKFRFCQILKY